MNESLTIALRALKAEALREAAQDLLDGYGPIAGEGADDLVAQWLNSRADAIETRS